MRSENTYSFLFGVLKLMCNGESCDIFQAFAVVHLRSLLTCGVASL